MYSTYNEGKSVVAERFIRTLKNKSFKHMTAISKNIRFNVLDDFNEKDPKFKVGDHFRISKHKKIFAKGYAPNWSEEVFAFSQIKNTVPWTYIVSEEITGSFYEKELQKTSKEESRMEKVLKRKGDKLYIKWKGYDSRFKSWIDKKDLIYKWVNTFLSRLEVLDETLTLKLIYLITQQKLI